MFLINEQILTLPTKSYFLVEVREIIYVGILNSCFYCLFSFYDLHVRSIYDVCSFCQRNIGFIPPNIAMCWSLLSLGFSCLIFSEETIFMVDVVLITFKCFLRFLLYILYVYPCECFHRNKTNWYTVWRACLQMQYLNSFDKYICIFALSVEAFLKSEHCMNSCKNVCFSWSKRRTTFKMSKFS